MATNKSKEQKQPEKEIMQDPLSQTETDPQLEAAKKTVELSGQISAQEMMLLQQREEIERLKKELQAERNKSTAPRKTDKQLVNEAIQKALAEGKNPWDVKIPIRARPRKDTTEKHYWLSVNGRPVALPADDRYHELPLPWAETLVNTMDAEKFVENYADREIKVYDLINNPHEEEKPM